MLKQLTLDEVLALRSGAEVTVTWAGGNGPHRYVVLAQCGGVLACNGGKPAYVCGVIAGERDKVLTHKVWA